MDWTPLSLSAMINKRTGTGRMPLWFTNSDRKKEKIMNLEYILIAIVVAVFAVRAYMLVKKANKIDEEGVETEAVVSRIEDISMVGDPETYTTYVVFTDDQGVERECPMTLSKTITHDVGDEVTIRYIPGQYELVREAKDK